METHCKKLNFSVTQSFNIDAGLVRESLTGILAIYKQKNKDELNTSGVFPEHTSVEEVLEKVREKMEKSNKLHNQTIQRNAKNPQQNILEALEIRQLALKTLTITTKRKTEKSKSETKKILRSSGSEIRVYLQEKAEEDREPKLDEMLLRREELELRKK